MPHALALVRSTFTGLTTRLLPKQAVAVALISSVLLTSCKSGEKTGDARASAEMTATSSAQPDASTIDPELALQTFDAAWQLVHDTHFDPTFNGVDWQAVRDEFRPRAMNLTDEDELRGVISEMLARLGQSHFALMPRQLVDSLEGSDSEAAADEPPASSGDEPAVASASHSNGSAGDAAGSTNSADDASAEHEDDTDALADAEELSDDREGDLGVKVVLINEEIVISHVEPASPASDAGLRSGWVIDEIDGSSVSERIRALLQDNSGDRMVKYYAMHLVNSRLRGAPGSSVKLTLRDDNDGRVKVNVTRRERPGEMIQFGNLPPMNALLEHERLATDDGANIGLIRFNIWMIPLAAPFAEAVDDLRDTEGIVIDLRGNPGGVGGMAMGLAGHFMETSKSLGTMKTRAGELNFTITPRRLDARGNRAEPFAGPVAILVDLGTASTSELFAGGMQAIGRARVFGETSAGAALPAMMDRLPNEDVLLHAFADFILPTGKSLEGTGVVPDEPIELTRKDLQGGRDPVLEAAIRWIASENELEPVALHRAE